MEGCGGRCMKILLLIINLIVALCGLGLITTGLLIHFGLQSWVPIEEVAALLDNQLLRSAVFIIIAAGGFVFLVAICGCLGALCESKCLLVLYFLLLFIVFAGQIAAGILAALYTRQISSYLEEESTEFLRNNYNRLNSTKYKLGTEAWNTVQKTLECCGVNGHQDYAENILITPYPKSCCPNEVCENNNVRSGCKTSIEKLISDYGTIIGATAVGVAFFELCCMLLAICVCRNIEPES